MKFSVVNSTGGSFCWNYATGTLYGSYAGDNVCCIYAGFEVVRSVTGMLMDLSVAIMQVTVSVESAKLRGLRGSEHFSTSVNILRGLRGSNILTNLEPDTYPEPWQIHNHTRIQNLGIFRNLAYSEPWFLKTLEYSEPEAYS